MLHVLVNKCKYRYFKLKEQIESPGSQYLRPFAIILSRHTSASLRLCETIFLKLVNQSRKARREAKDKKYRYDRHSSFLIENKRDYTSLVYSIVILSKIEMNSKLKGHKKTDMKPVFNFLA